MQFKSFAVDADVGSKTGINHLGFAPIAVRLIDIIRWLALPRYVWRHFQCAIPKGCVAALSWQLAAALPRNSAHARQVLRRNLTRSLG
ncbi:hypothetical protein RA28_18235 [Ruegeria sp. ANG-S4]|nr:hypothetical protein RA28_18235 [Ruegeria sp. ANG-S4]